MTTIVCTKCGFRNGAQDDFCGSCGEFLEFVGERVADPETETVDDAPVAPTSADVVIPEPEPELVVAEPAPPHDTPPAPAPTPIPKPPPAPISEPPPTPISEPSRAATSEPAPAAITEPPPAKPQVPRQPEAVQPGAIAPQQLPTRRRPMAAPAAPTIHPGDLVCGECGQGNDAARRFCRSCGASLVGAAVSTPGRRRWWHRFRRKPKVHVAGDRPMQRGPSLVGRIAKGVLGLAVVAAVIGLAGPWRSHVTDAFRSARKKVAPKFQPVNPVKAEASSSLAGHGPELAIDTGSNTWWAEGAKGNGEGQQISVVFAQPVDLGKIGFSIGAAGDQYLALPRPHDLHITLQGPADKPPATKDLSVVDKPDFQTFDLTGDAITRLDIQIRSVYPGQSGSSCAISDIQFFRRA